MMVDDSHRNPTSSSTSFLILIRTLPGILSRPTSTTPKGRTGNLPVFLPHKQPNTPTSRTPVHHTSNTLAGNSFPAYINPYPRRAGNLPAHSFLPFRWTITGDDSDGRLGGFSTRYPFSSPVIVNRFPAFIALNLFRKLLTLPLVGYTTISIAIGVRFFHAFPFGANV